MTLPWLDLSLFMIAITCLALYGLTASGHFPAEFRQPALKHGLGPVILWGTLVAAVLAAILVLGIAPQLLPWPAIVIGGGAMLLATPLLLRPFPDRFVNGPAGLVSFAAGAMAAAAVLWAAG